MSDVSKTNEALIAEAQQHYSEMNGLNSRAAEVMMELVAALEAKTGVRVDMSSATRVPVQGEPPTLTFDEARKIACVLSARGEFADGITVESIWARGAVWGALGGDRRNYVAVQGEPNDDREALDNVLIDAREAGDGLSAVRNRILAAGFSRATVPDAATEEPSREWLEDVAETHAFCADRLTIEVKKFERALAERDAALAALERVRALETFSITDSYPAWTAVDHDDLLAALDGAPEPEVKP